MATRKKPLPDRGSLESAMNAASEVVTKKPIAQDRGEAKLVTIRLDEFDHRRLKALFAREGVKLATGIKYAALWIAELSEAGALKVTKAGIIDRKG